MFWQSKAQEEPSVLKSGRKKCYEARDRFYECSDELGKPGEAVPEQCKALRQAYEDSCAASWVRSSLACRFVTFALLAVQAAAWLEITESLGLSALLTHTFIPRTVASCSLCAVM